MEYLVLSMQLQMLVQALATTVAHLMRLQVVATTTLLNMMILHLEWMHRRKWWRQFRLCLLFLCGIAKLVFWLFCVVYSSYMEMIYGP
jgi:hypothetical protein